MFEAYYLLHLNLFQTGLAVDDIKEILNTAEVRKLKSKVIPEFSEY